MMHGINVKSAVVAAAAVLATVAAGALENTNVSTVVDPKGAKPLPAASGAPKDHRKPSEIFVSSQSGITDPVTITRSMVKLPVPSSDKGHKR